MTWEAKSLEDLEKVAKELLLYIKHNIIQFQGEMGAGKTTLIREIMRQLDSEDEVSSPTYSLVNEYLTNKGIVYHFDFYRIQDESEAYDIGWEEYAYSNHLCLIEWPQMIKNLIPENNHILTIENKNDVRIISFQ